MSLTILDGKGSGSLMEVKGNRGQMDADIHTALEEHSEKGNAYAWSNATYNMTAADTIIAIRNTSPTLNLHIDKVFMSSDTVQVAAHHVTNGSAALAGTPITGVNMNFNSGNVAEADAQGDETTNSSQGSVVLRTELQAAIMTEVDFEGSIILGTNDSYAIDYPTDAAIVYITVLGFYAEPR